TRQEPITRSVNRFLQTHLQIDQIDEHLNMPLCLYGSAHNAKRHVELVLPENHGWNQSMERTLAGSKRVGMFRIQRKRAASVLKNDSRITGYNARTKRVKKTVDE